MSIESMVAALHTPDLPPSEKLLLLGIANHDGDGGAWPSIATLAKYVGTGERNVKDLLRKLEARGLVSVCRQCGGPPGMRDDRRPNLYRLHLHGVNCGPSRGADGVNSSAQRGEVQATLNVLEPSDNPPTPLKRLRRRERHASSKPCSSCSYCGVRKPSDQPCMIEMTNYPPEECPWP